MCVFSEQDGWMSIRVLRQQCPSFAHPFSLSLILLHPPPPHNLSPCLLIDLWAWHRRRAKESFPSPIQRSHCLLKHSLSHLHEWMLLCCNKWTIKKAGRQNVITEHLNDLPVKNHNLIPLNLLFQVTFEIQTLNSVFPQSIRWTNIPQSVYWTFTSQLSLKCVMVFKTDRLTDRQRERLHNWPTDRYTDKQIDR